MARGSRRAGNVTLQVFEGPAARSSTCARRLDFDSRILHVVSRPADSVKAMLIVGGMEIALMLLASIVVGLVVLGLIVAALIKYLRKK